MFFLLTFLAAWSAVPPTDLVEVAKIDFSIKQEIRYATPNNFMKKAVYPKAAMCALRKEAAEALVRVQNSLKLEGLGLKVWDCYRPFSVQKVMWEVMPDDRFVADPKHGSKHNRGAAVDLTLVDRSGNELEMPTLYDDFTDKAARNYQGGTKTSLKNRERLEKAMGKEGFIGIPTEWWHFDFKDWEKYPIEDVAFTH